MKNILILLDYYLPKASPNGICCANIAHELIQQGYCVSIVALRQSETDTAQADNDISVYYCGSRSARKKRSIDRILYYARWLLPYYRYPVTEDKLITAAYVQRCEELIEREQIDTLICVHLPVETLVAGAILKVRHPELTCIAYMLDSLSGGFLPRFLPQQYCRNRKIKWENALFTYFDHIILMESSRKHHESNRKKSVWYEKAIFLDIPLLAKSQSQKSFNQKADSPRQVAFCGLLNYPARNVPFILRLIKEQNNLSIVYIFVGPSNMKKAFAESKLHNVQYLGYLPHDKIVPILSSSNILLNLGVNVPSAISGKIFEYMSYGKPIISTYSIDNEACIPYLTKYPCALLLDERDPDLARQAKALEEFILKTSDINVNYSDVKQMFYQNTPAAFVEALDNAEK